MPSKHPRSEDLVTLMQELGYHQKAYSRRSREEHLLAQRLLRVLYGGDQQYQIWQRWVNKITVRSEAVLSGDPLRAYPPPPGMLPENFAEAISEHEQQLDAAYHLGRSHLVAVKLFYTRQQPPLN